MGLEAATKEDVQGGYPPFVKSDVAILAGDQFKLFDAVQKHIGQSPTLSQRHLFLVRLKEAVAENQKPITDQETVERLLEEGQHVYEQHIKEKPSRRRIGPDESDIIYD
jgi:hypothetical protein